MRAGSLGSFDRGRVYRVRASDVESVAGLWRMMAEEGPQLLHVSNLQAFVDSVPELRKQQADCLEAPDEEYYNRFTRYIPHMSGRGDTRLIEGMEPGMEVRDAHLRMFNVRTRMPQGYDERSIDAVRRDLKPDARGRVLHAGKVAGADATRRWFEKGHPIGKNCSGCALSESGAFYYPPKGFREWHTNKCQQRVSEEHTYREGTDDPAFRSTTDCGGLDGTGGWRAYVVYAAEDGQSWMSVVDGEGQIRSVPDRSGSINLFFLGHEDREATWHAIYSETHRWSVGFRVDEQWLNSSEGLLGQLRRDGATVEEFQIDGGEGRREGT